jgi:hypothetical protein
VLRGVYDYVVGRNESALVEARDRLDRIE